MLIITASYIIRPVTNKLHACFQSPNKTLSGYKRYTWTAVSNFLYVILNSQPGGSYMDRKYRPFVAQLLLLLLLKLVMGGERPRPHLACKTWISRLLRSYSNKQAAEAGFEATSRC